jgi:hypothetical protein
MTKVVSRDDTLKDSLVELPSRPLDLQGSCLVLLQDKTFLPPLEFAHIFAIGFLELFCWLKLLQGYPDLLTQRGVFEGELLLDPADRDFRLS